MSPRAPRRLRHNLFEHEVHPDPIAQFRAWLDEALAADLESDPTAMTLATATPDGVPSARLVLLKGFDGNGFVFYTNYRSRKARELEANPRAALVFWWSELERQVRIEGAVERVPAEVSDAYFETRAVGSRISAWASPQSEVVAGREAFERRVDELVAEHRQRSVPRPPFWGGYRVAPASLEFWQGRPNRLHDRLLYTRGAAGWKIERLAP